LETHVRDVNGFPILEVAGEIDIYTAPLFKQAVVDLVAAGHRDLFIDMAHVRFMDSSGFGTLLGATKRLRPQGGSLHLFHCSSTIEKMLHLIRLDTIIALHPTESDAIAAASRPRSEEMTTVGRA
jgi:anti-sigma B factor antagonist